MTSTLVQSKTEQIRPLGISDDFWPLNGIVPLTENAEEICIAAAHPVPHAAIHALSQKLGKTVRVQLWNCAEIAANLETASAERVADLGDAPSEAAISPFGDIEQDLDALKALAEDAPVVRLAQELLTDAVDRRASDVHIEPSKAGFRVRQRIDGVLMEAQSPPRSMFIPLISHLKLRAQMNIAERRLPQDGRIKLSRSGRDVDLRVATVPTVHGEGMVIRLLDQSPGLVEIADLGLGDHEQQLLESAAHLPHGMILVTGPTGSGKTTTLYAVLRNLNSIQNKIITVEDPVEYQIDGISQIQVKPAINLNFSNALRSIVRQDPDILMIGEIRDRETAEIAIQSALTGHLVLSTLHTNDAAGAPHRLLDMGVEPYLIASSVVLILAQRLLRQLCPHCKVPHQLTAADHLFLEQHGLSASQGDIAAASGCHQCGGTGYLGRTGIFEMLPMTDEIKASILRKDPASAVRLLAHRSGLQSLYANGLKKVISGTTTLEELARVARHDDLPANDIPD